MPRSAVCSPSVSQKLPKFGILSAIHKNDPLQNCEGAKTLFCCVRWVDEQELAGCGLELGFCPLRMVGVIKNGGGAYRTDTLHLYFHLAALHRIVCRWQRRSGAADMRNPGVPAGVFPDFRLDLLHLRDSPPGPVLRRGQKIGTGVLGASASKASSFRPSNHRYREKSIFRLAI